MKLCNQIMYCDKCHLGIERKFAVGIDRDSCPVCGRRMRMRRTRHRVATLSHIHPHDMRFHGG